MACDIQIFSLCLPPNFIIIDESYFHVDESSNQILLYGQLDPYAQEGQPDNNLLEKVWLFRFTAIRIEEYDKQTTFLRCLLV